MDLEMEIAGLMDGLGEGKRVDMQVLHARFCALEPVPELWFFDGRDATGKVVANPTIGYGRYTIRYANGSSKDSFRIGLSANTSGISVYVMGLADKAFLKDTYAHRLGKASVTGYCIKFKALKDIDVEVLVEAVRDGLAQV